jgi:SAM-dependent methyltransferase
VSLYTPGFAAFYDVFNTGWTEDFVPPLRASLEREAPVRRLLDLCCGTGVASAAFCAAGWTVVGVDRSPGMLGRARERLARELADGRARLVEAEAVDFAVPEPAGAAICLDGALNHLADGAELERCFACVAAALAPGGHFVVDLFTAGHFRRHWARESVVAERGADVVRRGTWDEASQTGTFAVRGAIAGRPVTQDLWSRVFAPAEVAAALAAAGLEPLPLGLGEPDTGCRSPACAGARDACREVYRAVKPSAA